MAHVRERGARQPPVALRDASSRNKRNLGHGDGYRYPHDAPDAVLPGSLMPEGLEDLHFFTANDRGIEGELWARLERLRGRPEGEDPGEESRPF
jgi:putative ATPase